MGKIKKFGTFSGVFTPSILTILGVIMYLRFPAILGQLGLVNTIGIIVIAHIISITTSLSVASLSTDKPVQNGGTYFMISRSLGLPIGGTLGWALFVGLSFSVSLYLIGFSESFLQYWGLENNLQTIRLTGTIVLIAVTTITFISTSLAIKSQYVIMVAIGLSLLSIFLGKHDFAPTEINFAPLATSAPFMILFGIFFPAVTGFEAGVSMSGDLRNPSKSLPMGAMMAVGVGFIVYIALAFFYTFTVDAEALANDPQILFKISLVPALVIAGIWGATLSSALGSILGAPRILQAIAMDKIAPKFLAKGSRKTNEPRNALLLAFVIAEAGILIGELDVIARIVSMFFITTYAFLNLASAIESWSSSDFRPAFKIPRFVSIVGTIAAFIVMILLDFIALAGATVVLGLLYFYLQRKELILESGDAWGSFWTNIAKKSLLKLSRKKDNSRNWRPNIILFSGGEKARPHLVELGLELTGKLGALTDFNFLLGNDSIKKSLRFNKKEKDENLKYFLRTLPCNTVEEGIKTVTNVYGFSGFEPNTVLMGWSKLNENREFLVRILKDLKAKNLNTVFLNYDKTNGFGKKESIDIWWNGKGTFLSLALNLLKFLQTSQEWRDSKVRLFVINSDSSLIDKIHRDISALLSDKRIDAEIKILSDDFGSRTKEDIIHSESSSADLLILGLSKRRSASSNEYIDTINSITQLPASMLLLYPSNEFEEINLIDKSTTSIQANLSNKVAIALPAFPSIENSIVRSRLEKLDSDFNDIGENFINLTFKPSVEQLIAISQHISESSEQTMTTLKREISDDSKQEYQKIVARNHHLFLRKASAIIDVQSREYLNETQKVLQQGINHVLAQLGNDIFESPETIIIPLRSEKKNKEKHLKYQYQNNLKLHINHLVYENFITLFNNFETASLKQLMEVRNSILAINDAFEKLLFAKDNERNDEIKSIEYQLTILNRIEHDLIALLRNSELELMSTFREVSINLANDTATLEHLKASRKRKKSNVEENITLLRSFSEDWSKGIQLLNNTLLLDIIILTQKDISSNIIKAGYDKILEQVSENTLQPANKLIEIIEQVSTLPDSSVKIPAFELKTPLVKMASDAIFKISDSISKLPQELSVPELIYKDSTPIPLLDYNERLVYPNKSGSYYVDTLFKEPFYRDVEFLQKIIDAALIEIKETCSLLLFQINNIKKSDEVYLIDDKGDLYHKMISQVQTEKEKIEFELNKLAANYTTYLHNSFSKLFYHSLIESDKVKRTDLKEGERRKINTLTAMLIGQSKDFLNATIINFINISSRGVILSKKYITEQKTSEISNRQILDFVEQVIPEKRIYNSIPVFYRDLMSSSSSISKDFWVDRNVEMELIKNALARHKRGIGGAVVIKGVHGAGKTTLSQHVLSRLFKKNNTFWINAPANGTTNSDDLLKEFQKSITNFSDYSTIFRNLPFESAIVINDLELWWERRPGGGDVILKIIELIKLYGHKVFFIINCNTPSFNAIKQLYPIENNTIAIVECEPFNSKELQQLILNRHRSSGLSLNYQDKTEENISQLKLSFLFNTYFYLSNGIPGVALNMWKSNIIEADQDSITIQKPERLNAEELCRIHKDWLIVISLFIHHKQLDTIKLARLTHYKAVEAENLLIGLKYAGILIEENNETYSLDHNIEPYLLNCCKTLGII